MSRPSPRLLFFAVGVAAPVLSYLTRAYAEQLIGLLLLGTLEVGGVLVVVVPILTYLAFRAGATPLTLALAALAGFSVGGALAFALWFVAFGPDTSGLSFVVLLIEAAILASVTTFVFATTWIVLKGRAEDARQWGRVE